MELFGLFMYLLGFLAVALIYAIGCLGVNINWGFTGLFNVGVAGFFAVGAYSTAIVTSPPSPVHLGGFDLPIPVGLVAAIVFAGAVAWVVGRICLRLRSDYLAIATVGIAEILRLVFRNFESLGGGPFGVQRVPRPFESLPQPWSEIGFIAVLAVILLLLYVLIQRAWSAPWGRVLRAIRDNEEAAAAAGKNVEAFRLQAFVLGSAIMGLFGGLFALYTKTITPNAIEPLMVTFLPWVMLIVGGSGNNKGAILGAMAIWALWTMTEILTGLLPSDWASRAAFIRVFLIGLLLQIVLQRFPGGLLPEKPPIIRAPDEKHPDRT
ncbi:MAG: branched-chain amino acid ABC transporter permease [Bauldia litoralis]